MNEKDDGWRAPVTFIFFVDKSVESTVINLLILVHNLKILCTYLYKK